MHYRVLPSGDRMVLVEFREEISSQVNSQVHAYARLLKQEAIPGVLEWFPTYRALGVVYDPLKISFAELVKELRNLARKDISIPAQGPRQIEIPVCYGGEMGPDLGCVAERTQLPPDEVVQMHSGCEYLVYFLGFSPGFPYLGGMAERLATPRLERPRPRVPAGSVAIGGLQTGIYSIESPGGWRILGRTPQRLFDPYAEVPFLLNAGDRVKFRAITPGEYGRLELANHEPSLRENEQGKAVFQVLKPGFWSTIQDHGRFGYQQSGVAPCGAMDLYALQLGNLLVGNPQFAPSLEITVRGPELRVLEPCQIAFTGADLSSRIDGQYLPPWENHWLKPGQILSFGQRQWGARSYLCVEGGFAADNVLGSCSTDSKSNFGGLHGRRLEKGDTLRVNDAWVAAFPHLGRRVAQECPNKYHDCGTLRVIPGPQIDDLAPREIERLCFSEYRISPQANRMGYYLDGPAIKAQKREIISDPVPAGAVQVLPNGQLVLLMADHQTVGGYPKIGVVITADLPRAAQLNIGDKIRFREVSLETAHQLLVSQESVIQHAIQIRNLS